MYTTHVQPFYLHRDTYKNDLCNVLMDIISFGFIFHYKLFGLKVACDAELIVNFTCVTSCILILRSVQIRISNWNHSGWYDLEGRRLLCLGQFNLLESCVRDKHQVIYDIIPVNVLCKCLWKCGFEQVSSDLSHALNDLIVGQMLFSSFRYLLPPLLWYLRANPP